MSPARALIPALAVAALAGAAYLWPGDGEAPRNARLSDTPIKPAAPAALEQAVEAPSVTLLERDVEVDDAVSLFETSGVRQLENFRLRLHEFLALAKSQVLDDHAPAASVLLAEVDDLADDGYLTAPEALMLRLSLLQYTTPETAYPELATALVKQAADEAAEAEREWSSRLDPRLEQYRARERSIVEEVAKMDSFADDKSRQAFLRNRLRDLRSEVYRN